MCQKSIFTDRVRSAREGNVYTWECLSVRREYHQPVLRVGIPIQTNQGVPNTRSGWGTPLGLDGDIRYQDWKGVPPFGLDGVPKLGLEGDTPIGTGWVTLPPLIGTEWGTSTPSPHEGLDGVPPPPPSGLDDTWTGYTAIGTPLAVSRRRTFFGYEKLL